MKNELLNFVKENDILTIDIPNRTEMHILAPKDEVLDLMIQELIEIRDNEEESVFFGYKWISYNLSQYYDVDDYDEIVDFLDRISNNPYDVKRESIFDDKQDRELASKLLEIILKEQKIPDEIKEDIEAFMDIPVFVFGREADSSDYYSNNIWFTHELDDLALHILDSIESEYYTYFYMQEEHNPEYRYREKQK